MNCKARSILIPQDNENFTVLRWLTTVLTEYRSRGTMFEIFVI